MKTYNTPQPYGLEPIIIKRTDKELLYKLEDDYCEYRSIIPFDEQKFDPDCIEFERKIKEVKKRIDKNKQS